MHAAANVTTEAATYSWLVAQATVQRQTGRHAGAMPTMPTQLPAPTAATSTPGSSPASRPEFTAILDWLGDLGLRDEFDDFTLLELAIEHGGVHHSDIGHDPLVTEMAAPDRDALLLVASHVSAYQMFVGAQQRGLPCGVVYAPEEAFTILTWSPGA